MAEKPEDSVFYLELEKYTVLGQPDSGGSLISDLFIERLQKKAQNQADSTTYLHAERLEREDDGSDSLVHKVVCPLNRDLIKKVLQEPDSDTELTFHQLLDTEALRRETDPILYASTLAPGIGTYVITFPQDSLPKDESESAKFISNLCDSIAAISENVSSKQEKARDKYGLEPPQIIVMCTYAKSPASADYTSQLEQMNDYLEKELRKRKANCHFVRNPKSKVLWAFDLNTDSLPDALDKKIRPELIEMPRSWINVYMALDDETKKRFNNKPVSKKKFLQIIRRLKVLPTNSEDGLEDMFHVFHLFGWLLMHRDQVFTHAFLCEIMHSLTQSKDGVINEEKIGMMLVDKGLAVKFGNLFIVPYALREKQDPELSCQSSAVPSYLAILKGGLCPISMILFWRVINAVLSQWEPQWDGQLPEYSNYILLSYNETIDVHLSLIAGVIRVAVVKHNTSGIGGESVKSIEKFAQKCQNIRHDLSDALFQMSGEQAKGAIKWGFACDHAGISPSSPLPCIRFTTSTDSFAVDKEINFRCMQRKARKTPQTPLTMKHKVWFFSESDIYENQEVSLVYYSESDSLHACAY
jgi:hypothetical protein